MISFFAKLFNAIPNPKHSIDLIRLKIAFYYVKSVKTFRLLFVSALGIGISLVFLLSSLILFHVSLFLYSPLSSQAKMYIGFLCAALYFGIAFFIFYKIFSESRWMKIFHAESISNSIAPSSSPEEKEDEAEAASHV